MVAVGREDELRELTRLSNNIFAFVDSERENANRPPSERRVRFAETCRKIGIEVCLTERRAIENYFPDNAVKSALGDGFSALAPFELLKASQKPWSKRDNWKIARQMELADIDDTDLGKFLQRI